MIEPGPELVAFWLQPTTVFSPAQRSAIEDLVSKSVRLALSTLKNLSPAYFLPSANYSCCTPSMTSPLGLLRPLDKSLDAKILRGDNLYQSQTIEIQLRLDDSSSGPMGSPVTMV